MPNKMITIAEDVYEVASLMPNFSGFVSYCVAEYSKGNIEVDWNEIKM